jgi:type IV pilus assembly protein PilO
VANPVGAALNKLPWYGQIGVFVAVSLILAGVFYYYYETPAQAAMAARNTELTAVRSRITLGQAKARQLPEFRKQISELEARLEVLKPILPSERDAGDLLRRVQTLAVQSNLTILGFKPQAISLAEMHAEWPINLQLEGSYHNFGMFLDRVSKFPRIINIDRITMGTNPSPTAAASMRIGVTATTFVLMEPTATAAPPAKKGAARPAKK